MSDATGDVQAIERAFGMFDALVERRLSGVPIDVDVQWVEVPLESWQDINDGPNHEPVVQVDGVAAEQYFLDSLTEDDRNLDDSLRTLGAVSFKDILATDWQDTIHNWTVVLPELHNDLDKLVDTVYRDRVIENASAYGLSDLLGLDQDMITQIARQDAMVDLVKWADAVDALEDARSDTQEK